MQPGLTDAERLLYTTRRTEASAKRHLLLTGQAVEQFVDQNGELVKYTKANLRALDLYIAELDALLDPCIAAARVRRPIGFFF